MTEEACPSQQRVHLRHEEGVVDWRWKLNVPKVTRTAEDVLVASLADVIPLHRSQCRIIEATCGGSVGVVQEDWIYDLLDRDLFDVIAG